MLQSATQLELLTTFVIVDNDRPENVPDSGSIGCPEAYWGASGVNVGPVHEAQWAVVRKFEGQAEAMDLHDRCRDRRSSRKRRSGAHDERMMFRLPPSDLLKAFTHLTILPRKALHGPRSSPPPWVSSSARCEGRQAVECRSGVRQRVLRL